MYKNRWLMFARELKSGRWEKGDYGLLNHGSNIRSVAGVACETYMLITGYGEWVGNKFKAHSSHAPKEYYEYSLQELVQEFYKTRQEMMLGDWKLWRDRGTFPEIALRIENSNDIPM